jgi:2-keto-4-pentenoate hydratase/2-oxohepta-3-ene-1,7-dioic acid hydratase in catechol pathway
LRLVLFSTASAPERRPGVIDGDTIRPIEGVASLDALVALEPAARDAAVSRLGDPVPRADATLHAPLYPRKNVFCVGRNYLAHAEEGARALGKALELPSVPTIFTKAPTAIADPDATLNLSGTV